MIRICKPGGHIVLAEPVNVINRCQLSESIAFLLPEEAGLLFEVWLGYHRGVKYLLGYDYDVALRMNDIIIECGISPSEIWVMKNPKHLMIESDNQGLVDEYSEENWIFASAGGISENRWNEAKQVASKLAQRKEQNTIVFCDSLFLLGFSKK
jgi:hypothetical protein